MQHTTSLSTVGAASFFTNTPRYIYIYIYTHTHTHRYTPKNEQTDTEKTQRQKKIQHFWRNHVFKKSESTDWHPTLPPPSWKRNPIQCHNACCTVSRRTNHEALHHYPAFSSFRLLHQSWVQISSLNTLSQLSTTYVSVRPKHIKNQDCRYAFQAPHFQTATGKKKRFWTER